MISKREIVEVRDALAHWTGRSDRTEDFYMLAGQIICGLNAAAMHPLCPHPAIVSKLADDVAELARTRREAGG